MNYIFLGKIVNTHGLKGEIRILSNFKYKDRVFRNGFNIYIGKSKKKEKIITYRKHKNFDMITLDGYNNIDDVLKYKGELVFFNRSDLELSSSEYLDEDIIGMNVYSDGIFRGIVKRIDDYGINRVLVVENNTVKYLIPYNFDIIKNIDIEKKEIHVSCIAGLFD